MYLTLLLSSKLLLASTCRFICMLNDLTFLSIFLEEFNGGYFLTLLGVDESGCRVLPTEDGATFPFCSSSLLFALRQTLSRLACWRRHRNRCEDKSLLWTSCLQKGQLERALDLCDDREADPCLTKKFERKDSPT